ncbi:RpiB/LacA/LacB family sugar-phosphate isomerase [Patescibacteria group bacterium]
MIYIASDHGGFNLKREVIDYLKDKKFKVKDLGPKVLRQDDDYPDFAIPLVKKVMAGNKDLGILICRNGIGISIVANKAKGIKAGLCTSVGQAVTAKAHDNCNVLVLAADYLPEETNIEIIKTFLEAEFSGEERHIKRLKKIEDFENSQK